MDRTLQVIEKLVNSAPPLVSFEATNLDRVHDLFKSLSLSHSVPFYQWSAEDGLHRMGARHIIIPRTRQPEHLLDYLSTLRHPGIFLLPNFASLLKDRRLLTQFKQILTQEGTAKTLILIDKEVILPEILQPLAQRVRLGSADQQRKFG